ncbi:MAG: helix-turn-helix domain-containing protein [Defluviitaleaceae bacterium]|nr:helix-turn-helix domain-containing protein [Defluviitaleaceae bacterium]
MEIFLKSSLDYIEQNLKAEITADELAEMANYSVGHYCRLFAQAMDSTVANYILKRRLDHALAEISLGRKAIGVVLEYGFNTYAGFYKAFVKMYGCSPKKYLSIYKKSEVFIMQNEKDLQAILANWDIPQGLKIEDASSRNWKTGKIEWQVWKIGDDYYLKTNERSITIKNIRIAKALEKEGLTSEFLPVPTTAGSDYLDGAQIFLLTKKVGEPHITSPKSDDELASMEFNNRMKHAYKLGQAIARLHCALKSVQDDVKPYEANKYKQGLDSIPKVKAYSLKHNIGIDDAFFDDYAKTFGELYDKLPKQLVHGNPTRDTVVYENGEVVGIKGYEIYNVSHVRLFDIIWCAGEINTQPIESYLKMFKEILKGYDSINPLTDEEKQSVYYMQCAASLHCIAHVDDDTFAVLKRNLKALVFLANNKEMFLNLL